MCSQADKLRFENSTVGPGTMFIDRNSGRTVTATVEPSDTEIYIFDADEKPLGRWKYPNIAHAFAQKDRMDAVLITKGDPDVQLIVGDVSLYQLLLERAPQLRRSDSIYKAIFWRIVIWGSAGVVAISIVIWLLREAIAWSER
jgi:hypothetical protein